MARKRYLKNAPITEALIDLRVALPATSMKAIEELAASVSSRFPQKNILQRGQFTFQMKQGELPKPPEMESAILGFICGSQNGLEKVQFRGDGFTFNKLKPYEGWSSMRDEAFELWSQFARVATGSLAVNRVALRYINHLNIPRGQELSEYLTASPAIPPALPQSVGEYLLRQVLNVDGLTRVIITQHASAQTKQEPTVKLLLDIDVFRENANLSHDDAWNLLEQFHELKNQVFFESITEKTAEMYE